jgi:glycosyltransferase involved in cell wall biosynthesis
LAGENHFRGDLNNLGMKPGIVIVSYLFHPEVQIGARRWSRYAFRLAELGHPVTVITRSFAGRQTYEVDGVSIIEFESNYPEVLNTIPKTILQKLNYRFQHYKRLRATKGSPFDRTETQLQQIVKLVNKALDRTKAKNLIITGAPFSLLSLGAEILANRPELRYFADLRDPWTWGHIHGMPGLDEKRMAVEKEREKHMVSSANKVLVPVEDMANQLRELYPEEKDKIQLLPHSYDEREIARRQVIPTTATRWIYAGTLLLHIDDQLHALCRFMVEHPQIVWDIYTYRPLHQELINSYGLEDRIRFHEAISPSALFNKMLEYDCFVCPWPDYAKEYLSTKFIEIFATKTPLIFLGNDGAVSQYVLRNKLGAVIYQETFDEQMNDLISSDHPFEQYNLNYNTSQWSLASQTETITHWLA